MQSEFKMTLLFDPTGVSADNLVVTEVHTPITEPDIFPTQGPFYINNFVVTGVAVGTGITSTLQLYTDYTLSPLFSVRSEQTGQDVYSYILLSNYTIWSSISLTYHAVGGDSDPILQAQIAALGNFDRTQVSNWQSFPGDVSALIQSETSYDLKNSGVAYLFANKLDNLSDSLSTPSSYLTFINGHLATILNNISSIQAQMQSWSTIFTQNGVLTGSFNSFATLSSLLSGYATSQVSDAISAANGLIKSNGEGIVQAATPDVDYTTPSTLNTVVTAAISTANAYANSISVNIFNSRGNYDASVDAFPTSGGSGAFGAIARGDQWFISVAGTIDGQAIAIGTSIYALQDAPGQILANWGIVPSGYGFTPENQANKATSVSVTTDYTGTISDTKYPSIKSIYTWVLSAFQTSSALSAYATGTSDAIIGAVVPAVTSVTNGLELTIRSSAANLTTTPSFTPNNGAISPATIVKGNGIPLLIGDIPSAGYWMKLKYDATTSKWVLLNPANGINGSDQPGTFKEVAGIDPPYGYLACPVAPTTISRSSYPALFNAIVLQNTVTITIASPGVVTWNNHPFINGMAITLYTTGSLPTGLNPGTTYYIQAATTNTFELSTTAGGGSIITTSGTQSGIHTAEYAPWGAGDGVTTFGMPYFPAGYVPVAGTLASIGNKTTGQVINHTHPVSANVAFSGTGLNLGSGFTSSVVSSTTGNPSNGGAANLAAGMGVLICVKY